MRRLRDEAGFTLVEMLVAVTILSIIIVPLGAGTFVAFRATTETTDTYAQSSDAQFVSIYFPPDVQSANSATTSTTACSGTSNRKVELRSTESGATVRIVQYWVGLNTGSGAYELVRSQWNAATCGSAAAETLVVARSLTGTGGATASINGKVVRLTVATADYSFTVTGRMRSA